MTLPQKNSFWYDERFQKIFLQVIILLIVCLIFWFFGRNLVINFQRLRLSFGFGFLFDPDRPASFAIGDSPIAYSPTDTYFRALLVGLVNSLRIMITGIFLAISLGIVIGLGRLSDNWLIRQLATIYVETIRNTPLLLQLFFWYFAVFLKLPKIEESLEFFGRVFLNNSGVYLPFPANSFRTWLALAIIILGIILSVFLYLKNKLSLCLTSLLILVIIPLIWGLQWQSPQVNPLNQNIDFGLHLSSEFATLLIGLTVYTAAFIAETVRGGIQSVNRGQWEAAKALGLKPLLVMRLVIFPQALPVIIPPLTNECLNLVKNSSLAIAIGYNDIYAISSTIANQTGKAVEMLIVVMATYLFFNLVISLAMNQLNKRVKIQER
jgi:general L-amino acid transport system permease protein